MDKIVVIPMKEVDKVKFGLKREDVRKIFGNAKEFKKSKFSKNTTDDFGFCHVFYDVNDECEAVELFNDVEIFVDETIVFPTNIENAERVLGEFKREDGVFTNVSKSVSICAPTGKMESILFGAAGYFE